MPETAALRARRRRRAALELVLITPSAQPTSTRRRPRGRRVRDDWYRIGLEFEGEVQQVAFRRVVEALARRHRVRGFVWNDRPRRDRVLAFAEQQLHELIWFTAAVRNLHSVPTFKVTWWPIHVPESWLPMPFRRLPNIEEEERDRWDRAFDWMQDQTAVQRQIVTILKEIQRASTRSVELLERIDGRLRG